jgi:hypothetical protein
VSQAASKVLITYRPGPDATSQAELNSLATVYRFILFESRSATTKAAKPAQPNIDEDAKNVTRRKEAGMT